MFDRMLSNSNPGGLDFNYFLGHTMPLLDSNSGEMMGNEQKERWRMTWNKGPQPDSNREHCSLAHKGNQSLEEAHSL